MEYLSGNGRNMVHSMECSLMVKYSVNGINYNTRINTNDKVYKKGDSIKLEYKLSDPNTIMEYSINGSIIITILIVLIFISLLILILRIFYSDRPGVKFFIGAECLRSIVDIN